MYYTIYKTTNLINNKIYIGLHTTQNPYDTYLGSGYFLKKAIRKYGYKNFKKEILFIFTNKQDMIDKERELVDDNFCKRKDTYNMHKGGYGLCTLDEENKKLAIIKIKSSLQKLDLKVRSSKRVKTMTDANPNIFKEIGKLSSLKQKENYKNGYLNPRLNPVNIYNSNNELMFKIRNISFKEFCKINNLPTRVLEISIQRNGIPIYLDQKPRNIEYLKYTGWYAKAIKE